MNKTVAKILIWSAVVGVVVFAAAFGLGYYDGYREAHSPGSGQRSIGPFLSLLLIGGAMGVGMWVSVLWMRSIDEAAREAHKSAWFWGGTAGMAVGFTLILMAMLSGMELPNLSGLWGRSDPVAYLALGAFAMTLIMTAGYTIAWGVWWLRRR